MGKAFSLNVSKMTTSSPLVVILGCTGTGKSKLAIELAKKFNGEIISADSMQVYKELDIVTNKVTLQEQNEAVHHLINCVDPLSRYTVVDFRNQALPIIEKLFKENKVPIIVGGTNYYIESLLWKVLVDIKTSENKLLLDMDKVHQTESFPLNETCDSKEIMKHKIYPDSFKNISSHKLHLVLQEIDPAMANIIHPQDRRKIIRSLQVYQQHGCRHSDLLKNQRSQDGGSSLGGPLRYKKCTMFWLQCDKDVLEKRLDNRIDEMIERDLLSELLNFHKQYNEKRIDGRSACYKEGIFQSIGFKEFHEYLLLSEKERKTVDGEKLLMKSIDNMKLATRQYAKKQKKWIVNRFLRKPDREVPPVYGLDVTDINVWEEKVLQPAVEILESFEQNLIPVQSPLPLQESINDVQETHYCEICDKIFVSRKIWEIHLKSKAHSKRKASLNKANKVQKCSASCE